MPKALGRRGEREGADQGIGELPGRKRKSRRAVSVAARLAAFHDTHVVPEGVTPLNPGFFKMQRLRTATTRTRTIKRRRLSQ